MKKKVSGLLLALPILLFSCKEKKKAEDKHFVSIVSLFEKQVAHVDTSLYAITRYTQRDSLHTDTDYIPREKFREAAREFLELPDLSNAEIAARFKEENRYDSLIRRVVIAYTPLDPKKEEIKKIELLVSSDIMEDSSNKVTHIIIDRIVNNRDGFLQKKMLWRTDKSFLIVTTTQLPGKPEEITTTRVVWNEEETP